MNLEENESSKYEMSIKRYILLNCFQMPVNNF